MEKWLGVFLLFLTKDQSAIGDFFVLGGSGRIVPQFSRPLSLECFWCLLMIHSSLVAWGIAWRLIGGTD
jgi:hypothetical protein